MFVILKSRVGLTVLLQLGDGMNISTQAAHNKKLAEMKSVATIKENQKYGKVCTPNISIEI